MSQFIAIDVETANPDPGSICQVGVVKFRDGQVVDTFKTLVDPEDYFDSMNTAIHGITASMVQRAPTFPMVYKFLQRDYSRDIIVHHTAFDRLSLCRAAKRYNLPDPIFKWLDSARVARRTWDEVRYRGYGLRDLADRFGIQFNHHDAAEDARAAGEIILHAIESSGHSLDEWLTLAYKRPGGWGSSNVARDGDPDGEWYGETVVFTGALSMPREKAAQLAAAHGCKVDNGVTKRTTWLVVGDQDPRALKGAEKSSKHRKAEEMIQKGYEIRMLKETDFFELIGLDN